MTQLRSIRRRQAILHAEGYLELGTLAHQFCSAADAKDYESRMALQALRCLERLDHMEMQGGAACYLRGQALRSLERFEEAIPWLKQAASAAPDDIHIWLALGWCYKRAERLDLAIDALEQALEYDPDEAIIPYNLACYWCLHGDKEMTLDYLSQAFELDSDYKILVHAEPDFDSLRSDPDFQALTSVIV